MLTMSILSMTIRLCSMQLCTELPGAHPKVTFRFEEFVSSAYRLHIATSQGSFVADFCPAEVRSGDRPFYTYAESAVGSKVIDLWPLNGKCVPDLWSLFSDAALRKLWTQAQVADKIGGTQLRIFVLDLKDSQGTYRNAQEISIAEMDIRDLLLLRNPRRTVHNRFERTRVQFFLREGLLKATLREILSEELRTLFDSYGSENRPGRDAFCMLCEHIMNGFKKGYAIHIQCHVLHPDEFFEYAAPPACKDDPRAGRSLENLQRVTLHTLYSACYVETYGPMQEYYLALARFFKTRHELDTNGITHIVIEPDASACVVQEDEIRIKETSTELDKNNTQEIGQLSKK